MAGRVHGACDGEGYIESLARVYSGTEEIIVLMYRRFTPTYITKTYTIGLLASTLLSDFETYLISADSSILFDKIIQTVEFSSYVLQTSKRYRILTQRDRGYFILKFDLE